MLRQIYKENENTHFMLNKCVPKIAPFARNVENFCRARQSTWQNNTANAG